MKGWIKLSGVVVLILVAAQCATDPGGGTSIAGSSVTKFTYETGSVDVVINYTPTANQIIGAAVLFDTNPTTGERAKATELDEGVTVTWPESLTIIVSGRACTSTLSSTDTQTLFKIFYYELSADCASDANIAGIATVTVNKNGASKTLNGNGSSGEGSGGGGSLTEHTVFVTSTTYNGNFGGLSGADTACATRAAAGSATVGLTGGTWRAIMSDDSINANDQNRINLIPTAPIKTPDGTTIVAAASSLWGGTLISNIDVTEDAAGVGGESPYEVWTGTAVDGTAAENCSNWTSAVGTGVFGNKESNSSTWTNWGDGLCNLNKRLYCIYSNE